MTTATVVTGKHQRAEATPSLFEGIRIGRLGLGTIGAVTLVIAAWGGLVPFIGPLFGFNGDGSSSWHWTLPHALVGLAPGTLGVLLGVFILAEARGIEVGRGRFSLASAGLLAAVCGAWLVIGPLAVPVLTNHGAYFAAATPLRNLTHVVGYAMGPGIILALCGGFTIGWATRHQARASLPVDGRAPAETIAPEPELV